jgi:hypothetical protein
MKNLLMSITSMITDTHASWCQCNKQIRLVIINAISCFLHGYSLEAKIIPKPKPIKDAS